MPAAKTDLGDVHLDHLRAVVGAAIGVELAATRTLVAVQDLFDVLDGFLGQMIELEEHRAIAAFQFLMELPHHLPAPVVALDEAFALVVGGVAAQGAGDVGAGRAVVILDQRVDLEAFQVRQFGPGVVGHRVAVAGIGRVFVGAHQVARGRQAQAPGGTAGEDHRLGLDHMEVSGSAIKAHHAVDRALFIRQQSGADQAIGDTHPRALQLPIEDFLDVVPFRHRQHISAHVVDLFHRVVAGFVLLEFHAPAVQLFDRFETVGGIGVHRGLVDDAVVGDGDFLGVLLRCRVAGNDRVVQAVHAHADRAAALDVGLVDQQHPQVAVAFLGLDRRHGAGGAAANDNDVVFLLQRAARHACSPFCRSIRRRYWNASPR
ncbi:hypothetical protein D3C85_92410 [compost metagenome]